MQNNNKKVLKNFFPHLVFLLAVKTKKRPWSSSPYKKIKEHKMLDGGFKFLLELSFFKEMLTNTFYLDLKGYI